MDRLVQMDREQLAAQLRREMVQTLARVMDAFNAAPLERGGAVAGAEHD